MMAILPLYCSCIAITPYGRRPRQQRPVFMVSDDAIPALKRHLAQQLVGRLEGWSQTHAAALLGTDQPRMSDLRRGRLDRISLEQLVRFVGRVGGSIELQVSWSSRHSFLYARWKQP
jgi:predicted XRE-type DNA-binding protein